MNLYRISFRHYSQKDSKEGTETFLLAENDEQVFEWLAEEAGWDFLGDEDTGYLFKNERWLEEHPEEVERARAMGLTVNEHGDIKGPMKTLILFHRGEVSEPSDLYYGCTQWFWELVETRLFDEEAGVLERFGFLCRA